MFDRVPLEKQTIFQTETLQNELSRRSVLRAGGLVVATLATPESLRQLASYGGELYDAIASPEDIISHPITPLEPRENNTPVVTPQPRLAPIGIRTEYTQKGEAATLRFTPGVALRAEHTDTLVRSKDEFTSAGTAIITTAEGLTAGEQAYCTLFKGKEQVIAVGYEGGLYMYEPALGQDQKETSGEWVRIVAQEEDGTLPSHVSTTTPWKDLEAAAPHRMLIQKVIEGTETLRSIGYRPWAAILPSTQMPDMAYLEITQDSCAKTAEEVIEGNKSHFVTERGDIVDLGHLQAKAGETLELFTQLYSQYIAGEAHPKASIGYTSGSDARFQFSVHPDSLQPQELYDTTFSIMNDVTMLMEGISQQYAAEKIPGAKGLLSRNSRMSPEDMFANSLAATGMISFIRHYEMDKRLEASLSTLRRNNPGISAKDMNKAIEGVLQEIKPLMVKQVLAQTVRSLGVRKQETPVTVRMPRGMYSLIPTKISDKDAATPTRIDMRATGIRPDNPKVRRKPTHVPAMQSAVEHILGKLSEKAIL